MKNNKGISFVFITFLMCVLFAFISAVWSTGMNDMTLSRIYNDKSKSYYVAEAGIYYAGSIIFDAVNASGEPPASLSVNNPFSEYKKEHGFNISITKLFFGIYRVTSEGTYNSQTRKIQARIFVSPVDIFYSEIKTIN